MAGVIPASVRAYLAEPTIPDAPVRLRRDWVLVGVLCLVAVLEAVLRRDEEFATMSAGWRLASLAAFLLVIPYSLLIRRTRPLRAVAVGFGVTMGFGVVFALVEGPLGGLMSSAAVLIAAYALYRWGSGRQGAVGLLILAAAAVIGNITDPGTIGDVIGGLIVLSLPVELGLMVRYRAVARVRVVSEAKSLERERLARELHDTVAHHVSAIAVQAQAGRAVAAVDPQRALAVLAVIEEAASRTLEEMRAMVDTLRAGAEADLAPGPGMAELGRLVETVTGALRVEFTIDNRMGEVAPAVGAAVYRIAQESITNAVRHARRASWIRVQLAPHGDVLRLTVIDDGETASGASGDGLGYGLLGMAERARLLGGRFHAGPTGTGGWQVVAELPLVRTT